MNDKDNKEIAAIRVDVAELKTDMRWVKEHLSAQKVTLYGLIASILALVAAVVRAA